MHDVTRTLLEWVQASGDDVEMHQRRDLAVIELYTCMAGQLPQLSWNGLLLRDLPDIFDDPRLRHLQYVNLEGNALKVIPQSLGSLPELTTLICANNGLTVFPLRPREGHKDFPKLVMCNCSGNPLGPVDSAVFNAPTLKELVLCHVGFGPDQLATLREQAQSYPTARPPLAITHEPFPT